MAERRIAVIDIGTNSVLFLAAVRRTTGEIEPLAERIEITRLGRGVDRTKTLAEEAMADTLLAVGDFLELAWALECTEVYATATSAARDAANGAEFVGRAQALGVTVEVIDGEREAALAYTAVAREFARENEALAVVDIGGGSTEIILGDGAQMRWRHSFDVGSVRLTERHLSSDPPSANELETLVESVRTTLVGVPHAPVRVVGIAGTFTTLATVELGLETWDATQVHGRSFSLERLRALSTRLAALPLEERKMLPGLPEKRADVIVAGAYIACGALEALEATQVTVSDRGVRWGLLYEKFGF